MHSPDAFQPLCLETQAIRHPEEIALDYAADMFLSAFSVLTASCRIAHIPSVRLEGGPLRGLEKVN